MKKLLITAFATVVALALPAQVGSSSVMSPPKSGLLGTWGVSVSYKDEVRLARSKCGEFDLKYSVRDDPKRALVQLFDSRGVLIGDTTINRFSEIRSEWDDPKGSLYFEYCKTRWRDDWGNVWPAFKGGWVSVHLTVVSGSGDRSTQKGRFFVKK